MNQDYCDKNDFNLPIIMCTWKRIDNLSRTLDMLEVQLNKKFVFYIWNNNIDKHGEIDRIVKQKEYTFDIRVRHSEKNIKGFGRFFFAKYILDTLNAPFIAFIDDDIEFKNDMVEKFLNQAEPRTIKSFWGYRFAFPGNRYWIREESVAPDRMLHYCGTGGMILDTEVFKDERLFLDIPEEYHDVEDLWLSFFVSHFLKWRLLKSDFSISLLPEDGKDQYKSIYEKKDRFLIDLNEKYRWPNDYTVFECLKGLRRKYDYFYQDFRKGYVVKNFIKMIPILGPMLKKMYKKHKKTSVESFTSSEKYWKDRYESGRNSGDGSYGRLAAFKAGVLNKFIKDNGCKTVIEYGCGDGNQLGLSDYASYIGFDVSLKAVEICKDVFSNDKTKVFKLMADYNEEKADVTLSLDVIYHLVEDEVFNDYMQRLFNSAEKYVIIYSSNMNKNVEGQACHVKHRMFTTWVEKRKPEWILIDHIPNQYQFDGDTKTGSFADFFIYKRIK